MRRWILLGLLASVSLIQAFLYVPSYFGKKPFPHELDAFVKGSDGSYIDIWESVVMEKKAGFMGEMLEKGSEMMSGGEMSPWKALRILLIMVTITLVLHIILLSLFAVDHDAGILAGTILVLISYVISIGFYGFKIWGSESYGFSIAPGFLLWCLSFVLECGVLAVASCCGEKDREK